MRGKRSDARLVAAVAAALVAADLLSGGAMLGLHWPVLGRAGQAPCEAALSPTEPPQPGEVSLLMCGDVLPLDDRDYLTAARPLIGRADLAVCNLECPLSTHGRPSPLKLTHDGSVIAGEFLFRAPPAQAARLAEAGFDAVTLANNHVMDFGGEALLETLHALERAGVRYAGAGPDLDGARTPALLHAGGQTVALLAYAAADTLPGTEHFAAGPRTAGTVFVAGNDRGMPTDSTREMLREDIAAARETSDAVVVSFHWGEEGQPRPTPLQRALAHCAIDAGAQSVVGHHPHVLQGIELYRGRPIAYSLGNFVFATPWEHNRLSAALELRLRAGAWTELVLHPVALDAQSGDPRAADEGDRTRIVARLTRLSSEMGTGCQRAARGRLIVRNPEPERTRERLLVAERPHFGVDDHRGDGAGAPPRLDGMATVRFLAWDLAGAEKVACDRQVVVCEELAPEVLQILRDIYLDAERFPIHEVVGYCDRTVAGGSGPSLHAVGRAIDINRAENPMLKGGRPVVHPDEPPYEPKRWRPDEDPYSIPAEGSVVRAFTSRGWRWGGDWTSCRDYQHFDRPR